MKLTQRHLSDLFTQATSVVAEEEIIGELICMLTPYIGDNLDLEAFAQEFTFKKLKFAEQEVDDESEHFLVQVLNKENMPIIVVSVDGDIGVLELYQYSEKHTTLFISAVATAVLQHQHELQIECSVEEMLENAWFANSNVLIPV